MSDPSAPTPQSSFGSHAGTSCGAGGQSPPYPTSPCEKGDSSPGARQCKAAGATKSEASQGPARAAPTWQEEQEIDRNNQSVSGLMWKALAAGHHFGRTVKPKPYMSPKDSTHLTTHEQQLRAYRAYEDMLQGLPNHLNEPEYLLEVADKLLHLPETFPASYLQLYDPLVPQCLKLSGSLQFIDLEAMLGSNAPQLDLASLKDSIVGYGFLTTAQYIADLFFAVADIPGVRNAQFPAMLCYSDPDYWIGALLLAFEAHQNGPPGRAAGLPIVLGFRARSTCPRRRRSRFWLVGHIKGPPALRLRTKGIKKASPWCKDRCRSQACENGRRAPGT